MVDSKVDRVEAKGNSSSCTKHRTEFPYKVANVHPGNHSCAFADIVGIGGAFELSPLFMFGAS